VNHAVIGLKNALRWVLRRTGEWRCEELSEDGAEIDLLTNLETGARFINARYLHGDRMLKLVEELYGLGVRRFTHVGTAGSLVDGAAIGDILIPETVTTACGETYPIPNALLRDSAVLGRGNARIFRNVRHGSVGALLEETRECLDRKKRAGFQSLDIETQYLAPFFIAREDASLSEVLIVSDVPLARDLGYDGHGATIHVVVEALAAIAPALVAPHVSSARRIEDRKSPSNESCHSDPVARDDGTG
jgi:hypothetical protein